MPSPGGLLKSLVPLAAGAGILSTVATLAASQPPVVVERLGFFDAAHTRNDGAQFSEVFGLVDGGKAIGFSVKYAGATLLGPTIWVDGLGQSAQPLGLYDAEHVTAGGSFSTSISAITQTGKILGASGRFLGGSTSLGQTAWRGTAAAVTTEVGFYDAEHTGSGGFQSSQGLGLNAAGDVRGSSLRYGVGGADLGQSSWVASELHGTQRVGLVGTPEFRRADGYAFSDAAFLNTRGDTAGISNRYNGGVDFLGQAAWLADRAGNTQRIGLHGTPEFTSTNGFASSAVEQLTDTGRTRGHSDRFSGDLGMGQAAWVADDAGVTTRVGFVGAEFTRADGYRWSSIDGLTDGGLSRGTSERFAGSESSGFTAWVANTTGSTFEVGLSGAEFERADGYRSSETGAISEAGMVVGVTQRYAGSASAGQATWRAQFDGVSTPTAARIGFFDTEHTRADGFQSSAPVLVTGSGIVAGSSRRYEGGAILLGQSAWVSPQSGGTQRVGLVGSEFRRADGWEFSAVDELSESGVIAGYSTRYNGSSARGQATWVATAGGSTARVGLFDSQHTAADGTQFSEVSFLTDTGFSSGWSDRFDPVAGDVGQSAWVFSGHTGLTTALVFSTRLSDGFAFSEVTVLLDNGWTLGDYTLFGADGEDLGQRAFLWTPESGGFDLGSSVFGGLGAAGFQNLLTVSDGSLPGVLAGLGTPLNNAGQAAYIAQVIPEPSALGFLLFSGLALAFAARRREPSSKS